jgi:hypothetical protein
VPRPRRAALWTIACLFALVLPVLAQRGGGRRFFVPSPGGVEYDGQLTIVRLYYANYPGWSYDYPDMEQNFTLILKDISLLPARKEGSRILRMDDPDLLKFPIAYLSEPGYWYPTDSEAEGLRTYLAKGGFLIVDDFHFEREWAVFAAAMRKVLPAARIDQLDRAHPVFNSFFSIKSLEVPYPGRLGEQGLMGEFLGIHEDNTPRRRLMVSINYNIDIGDYVEWSGENLYNPLATNEAYKFMINYIVYGMTH